MTPDDKSTILEFLGWKSQEYRGVITFREHPSDDSWQLKHIPLDENLLAQALAKLSEEQRFQFIKAIIAKSIREPMKMYDSFDNLANYLLFDCPLSTKAEVLAGVIRNSNKGAMTNE